jgi:hypothetical protein
VVYASGTGTLATGSGLTFNGTNLSLTSGYLEITGSNSLYLSSGMLTSSSGAFPLILGFNGTEKMRIGTSTIYTASGVDVGIGTSSPQAKLHVANSSSGVLFAQDSTTANIIGTNAAGTVSQGLFLKGFPLTFTGNGGGGTTHMTLDSEGRLGLGVTPSAWYTPTSTALQVRQASFYAVENSALEIGNNAFLTSGGSTWNYINTGFATRYNSSSGKHIWFNAPSGTAGDAISFTTAMTLDASGRLLVGKTTDSFGTAGTTIYSSGEVNFVRSAATVLYINRLTDDGELVAFNQAGTQEGNISVSGTTVSYNGGHLSRWAQTTTTKDESLVKGTVLSNLDAMNVYTDSEGNPVDNEQLNKVKVSDTEGDVNVAGVFVNWSHDDAHNVDEINMAMTGDMIIRIAQGVTVVRGDLLMSAGDGTAKPQGDDIVRSKTVAKVTSNHITCTYADGSYCVPCVLMAC